jgi:zinc transport system substrate-binding protein
MYRGYGPGALKRLLPLTVVCVLGAIVAACQAAPKPRAKVAASIFPVYDLVRRIAGPDADVVLVLPRGANPETWSPPPTTVPDATVLVSVGLNLDPWMQALVPPTTPRLRRVELGDRVPTLSRADGSIDPYAWMDPQRARLMVTAIAEELARADSSHAAAFRDRATALDAAIATLDRETEAQTAPLYGRPFVATHDGLSYYAERYKLHVIPSGHHDATATNAPKVADDALGANPAANTYEDLIRANTAALESALR